MNILTLNNSQKRYSESIRSNKFQAHKFQKNMMAIYTQNQSINQNQYKIDSQRKQKGSLCSKKPCQQVKVPKFQSVKGSTDQIQPIKGCIEQQIKDNSISQQLQAQNWQDIWNMLDKSDQNHVRMIQTKKQCKKQEDQICELTQEQLMEIFGSPQNQSTLKQKKPQTVKQEQIDEDLLQIWNQLEFEQKKKVIPQANKDSEFEQDNQKNHLQQNFKQCEQIFTFSPVIEDEQLQQEARGTLQSKQIKNKQHSNSFQEQQIIKEIRRQCYNIQMTKLIFSQDFVVYNYKDFCLTPYKHQTYTYFGLKESLKHQDLNQNIFSLYSFETKQNILSLQLEPFKQVYVKDLLVLKKMALATGHYVAKKVMEYDTKFCYKITICSTGQRVATLFWKQVKDGLVFELKLYDQYEQKHTQSLAIIQIKDGFVAESCYCDTNVYIANQSARKFKDQDQNSYKPSIQKLRMILNIRNQKLTANMGINGIQSSPYNCCLQNKNKKFIYLMGMFKAQNLNKFIIKIGQGVSPLIGMAIAAGRKIYIDSFQ